MTRPARLVLPGLVALVMTLGTAARAEPKPKANVERSAEKPDEKRARALELFDKSVVSYDSGRFAEAAALLEEAYATFPEPVLLYNLARAYQESGELAKSIDAYERFLAADPEVKDRGGIEQRIVALREQLRAAERAKADTATNQPQAKPNPTKAPVAAVAPGSASAPHDPGTAQSASIAPWIVAGVGAAALGAGVVLGIVANSRHESAKDEPVAKKAASLQDQAEDYALAANVALVAGGVLATAGATWGIIVLSSSSHSNSSSRRPRTHVAVGPASVRFSTQF